MRLRKIKLTNFRGYRNTTRVSIDEEMTGIVGRNDFGKSTIFKVPTTFFKTEGMKADRNDMNYFSLGGGTSHFKIVYEFGDLPGSMIIGECVRTTLASEHLLNKDGNLEIVKSFKTTTIGKPE